MTSIKLQFRNYFLHSSKLPVLPKYFICALVFLAATSGCSTIVTISPEYGIETRSMEEFNLYADNVFRRQSAANSKIIMYLIDYETGNEVAQYDQLIDAEEKIVDACKNLNYMAVRKAERQEINFLQKYLYAHSVDRCEHATRSAEGLLQKL